MKAEPWIARLFLAVALLQIVPVWSAPYFPTADGPAHLYNAWVMREIGLRHDNAVTRAYAIDPRPYPNLLDHVALAMLLGVVPPPVAEKVFVSAVILLVLGGIWLFAGAADPRASLFAFLAVPLAHHQMLQSGFYNFSLSVGLYFLVVALWWRRRERPDGQTVALIALLLLLCYFAHPLSTALAIGSIGALWLATLRGRTLSMHMRHLLAFVPVLPLLAWFLLRERGGSVPSPWSAWNHLTFLAQTQNIVTFDVVQLRFGAAICVLTLLLMAITVAVERRRRDADAFLVILAIVLIAFELAPGATAGGSMILERLALFIAVLPLPWLTPRLTAPGRAAFAVAMAIVAAVNTAYLVRHDRRVARETTKLVRAAREIPPNRTFYPVVVDRQPDGALLALVWHAPAYAAIERGLVDLNNYEPGTGYFPVRYRDAARMHRVESIADDATDFPVDRLSTLAEYVFTWHMPADAPVVPRLDGAYALRAISKDARIYERTHELAFDEVLLPIAGTAADTGGPYGELWGVEQVIRNRGPQRVDVELSACAANVPCRFTLAPGEARRLAADDPWRPYIVARIARPGLAGVAVATVAHRTDRDGSVSRLGIPSIPLAAFATRPLDLAPVPLNERLTLRVWCYGSGGVTLIVESDDCRELARREFPVDVNGYLAVHDLQRQLAPLAGRVRLHVEARDAGARVWAFVTGTSGRDAGELYLPQTPPCTLH